MYNNPFIYGKPVSRDDFLGREDALEKIVNCILASQSTALIGEPYIGKTSFLYHLNNIKSSLFGEQQAKQIIFSYMDAYNMLGNYAQAQFWKNALSPLKEWIETHQTEAISKELEIRYQICDENNFGCFTLEQLLKLFNLDIHKLSFVLMIDHFDVLIHHSFLNKAEFFGVLHALALRCPGFVTIITGRQDFSELHSNVLKSGYRNSPYFDIFIEVKIGALGFKDIVTLLKRGECRFSETDYNYIRAVADAHPYLLQAAAAAIWDVAGQNLFGTARYQKASQLLYQRIGIYFNDLWELWTGEKRKIFTAVALIHITTLLYQRKFISGDSLELDISFQSELLYNFEATGLLEKTKSGQWHITRKPMLWWLTDKLISNVRNNIPFEEWLKAEKLDGTLSGEQKEQLQKGTQQVIEFAQQGVTSLIEATANGIAELIEATANDIAAEETCIFISSDSEDEPFKNKLLQHIAVLKHQGIRTWDASQIVPGDNRRQEISNAIDSCHMALLLVSPDFISSKSINSEVLPRLLMRRKTDGIRVIPVILKPCLWEKVLGKLQALPKDGKPLISFSEENGERDRVWTDIIKELSQ